jgi:hypothetical protein
MHTVTATKLPTEPPRRRWLLGALGVSVLALCLSRRALAQEHGAGESGGSGGHGAGESAGHGSGGQHGGGGSGGGGEESGGRHGAGRTSAERAVRHRQRTGRTLGGGENTGGHTGGGGENTGGVTGSGETGGGTTIALPADGSTTGPIGGSTGGEHFVHRGTGGWGADGKVLRRP